jgi:hypothetical protein
MYLNKIPVNSDGSATVYHDSAGNTTFTVAMTSVRGPIVTVNARKD